MKKQPAGENQSERFKQELGCDESEERFNAALKAAAKHKPREHQEKIAKSPPIKASSGKPPSTAT
jgi:hypothetical protein